ncbi:hypothetical protein [Sinorhizobium meliloti]|uniref:hypothetical protein n=1 Tax=Rhizobium meliloti TaxID=382 RepID=UPI00299EF75D|nr:hypothetical protein [Sinorhizobium meliloti]MDW9991073.1 hypothetical protein [Sinorhizobium meliloti]MDX0245473.1 hypothetical protein [Sinorhizobium meliloti]MDX0401523.1 hypothetical protein [Sinorhizobium meliloti]
MLISNPKKRAEFFALFDRLIDLATSNGWYDVARIHINNREQIKDDLKLFGIKFENG